MLDCFLVDCSWWIITRVDYTQREISRSLLVTAIVLVDTVGVFAPWCDQLRSRGCELGVAPAPLQQPRLLSRAFCMVPQAPSALPFGVWGTMVGECGAQGGGTPSRLGG
jgi:hypothetical protein